MLRNYSKLPAFLAAAVVALAASSASALTYCPNSSTSAVEYGPYGSGSGTPIKLGVAANFAVPLKNYLNSYYSGALAVVCSDSTTALETLQDTGLAATPAVTNYDMIFAADTSVDGKYTNTFNYAIGTPVLFGYTSGKTYTITNINSLLSTSDSTNYPVQAEITGNTLGAYSLSQTIAPTGGTPTPSPSLDVANPASAPYGAMAQTILNHIGPVVNSSPQHLLPTYASDYSAWLASLSSYSNITKAFNAVGGTVRAGFAAKSQMTGLNNVAYIEFSNNDYRLTQDVANFTSNDVFSFVCTQMASTGSNNWASMLDTNLYRGFYSTGYSYVYPSVCP